MFQKSDRFHRRSTRNKSSIWQSPYKNLEPRQMLTTIFGTEGADVVNITSSFDETSVSVRINQEPEITFAVDEFDELIIDTLGGEDDIRYFNRGAGTIVDNGVITTRPGGKEVSVINSEILSGTVSSFEFHGSDGDDTIDLRFVFEIGDILGTSPDFRFNIFFDSLPEFTFDGGGGYDTIVLQGLNGPDEFIANGSEFEFNTFRFGSSVPVSSVSSEQLSNFEKVQVNTGLNEGELVRDSAVITGTEANDTFIGRTAGVSRFIGDGYEYEFHDFNIVDVDGGGGEDVARLSGTDLFTDNFFATDGFASVENRFSGSGLTRFAIDARNFETVVMTATENRFAGHDVVVLAGTPADETFVGLPDGVVMQVGDSLLRARNFERVTAEGRGGSDTAYLAGSDGDDSFVSGHDLSYLRGNGYFNAVRDFDLVVATSSEGGNDSARFLDSPDDGDVFFATPDFALMRNDGFQNRANGFSRVIAFSNSGADTATFLDSSGNDIFVSSPTQAFIHDLENYSNEARNFSRVTAFASDGTDQAITSGSSGDDRFVSSSEMSFLRGDGFFNQGHGFDRFDAIAGAGGEDTVILFDASGDDTLGGLGDSGWLFGPDYFNAFTGFERVTAVGNEGGVNQNNQGVVNYETILVGDWIS